MRELSIVPVTDENLQKHVKHTPNILESKLTTVEEFIHNQQHFLKNGGYENSVSVLKVSDSQSHPESSNLSIDLQQISKSLNVFEEEEAFEENFGSFEPQSSVKEVLEGIPRKKVVASLKRKDGSIASEKKTKRKLKQRDQNILVEPGIYLSRFLMFGSKNKIEFKNKINVKDDTGSLIFSTIRGSRKYDISENSQEKVPKTSIKKENPTNPTIFDGLAKIREEKRIERSSSKRSRKTTDEPNYETKHPKNQTKKPILTTKILQARRVV
ncbi:hypothetical protein HK096_006350 [Nowakowskiella sp. JEL0078]|nr:hypothetical protein HK096_006350 [Nowakowskiella sp. JEL0078]